MLPVPSPALPKAPSTLSVVNCSRPGRRGSRCDQLILVELPEEGVAADLEPSRRQTLVVIAAEGGGCVRGRTRVSGISN